MKIQEQIDLLQELLGLKERRAPFLDAEIGGRCVSDYLHPERFEQERACALERLPMIVAHASEIPEPNSFVRRDVNGQPFLLIRGDDGQVRVLLNVCRHRGTRLVGEEQGCRLRLSCPYHAWTWDTRGQFVGAPHFEAGFSGLEESSLQLKALPCAERYGFVWLFPDGEMNGLDGFLSGLSDDLEWLAMDRLHVAHVQVQRRRANWKLLVEGGLEAYHFRVAHRDTIARLFNDNLSSYQAFGTHVRSILPRSTIVELKSQPTNQWNIREHANLLYTLFPNQSLLAQRDHVVWIRNEPIAVDQTELRIATLVPSNSAQPAVYWRRNHELTCHTLEEDFDLAESIQAGLASGANAELRFGRFEGALTLFNQNLDECLRQVAAEAA